jgi:1-phosphatidylinositol-4-phosphate 5-kinase
VGREYNEAEAAKNPRAVLKDLNWIRRGRHLELGPEKRKLFVEQLEKDVAVSLIKYNLCMDINTIYL